MFTFKSKLDLSVLVGVILLAVVHYLIVIPPWAARVQERAEKDVTRAAELVERIQRLHSYDLVAVAKEVALRADLIDAIVQREESARRQGVFDVITDVDKQLRRKRRKPDFLAVVDGKGRVVARDLNIEDMHGEKLPYPSIAKALSGHVASDVWFMKNRMMRAAAAPISVSGQVKGSVVIAYDFTAAEARREAQQISTDVVYFMDNAVRASSFFVGEAEDGATLKLASARLVAKDSPVNKALDSKKTSDVFSFEIGGEDYLAVAGPLPEAVTIVGIELTTRPLKSGKRAETIAGTSQHKVGFAVLVNLDARLSHVTTARYMIGVFALIILFLLLGVKWLVTTHFVSAEDELELGVNEVINGNIDYTFDTMQEFEGLANALNVMLARLLGRPEPGQEEDADAAWRPDVLPIEPMGAVPSGVDVKQLAAEPEEAYYERLYREYIAARNGAQLPVEGITREGFIQKARANEAMIKAKQKCRGVRFVVHASAGRVSLTPVRLG